MKAPRGFLGGFEFILGPPVLVGGPRWILDGWLSGGSGRRNGVCGEHGEDTGFAQNPTSMSGAMGVPDRSRPRHKGDACRYTRHDSRWP